MTGIIIGSTALAHWFPGETRVPRDHDMFTDHPSRENFAAYVDSFWDPRLDAWPWVGQYADMDELLTLKISHSYFVINNDERNWDKHFADIIFLQSKGAVFLRELHDIALPVWKDQYRKNKISLVKTKADFFNDNVHRPWDHDSLHETVAHYDRPLYESVLKPGSEVDCLWSKFLALEPDVRLDLLREEIYVTALERLLIPKDYKLSPKFAYHWALRRCATSLLKNEWALYLLLHAKELSVPSTDYVATHLSRRHLLREAS